MQVSLKTILWMAIRASIVMVCFPSLSMASNETALMSVDCEISSTDPLLTKVDAQQDGSQHETSVAWCENPDDPQCSALPIPPASKLASVHSSMSVHLGSHFDIEPIDYIYHFNLFSFSLEQSQGIEIVNTLERPPR